MSSRGGKPQAGRSHSLVLWTALQYRIRMENRNYIELADLQDIVRERIGVVDRWVRVEIASHSEVRGHHYLDLIQKSPAGDEEARARGIIWKSNSGIISRFGSLTGQSLLPGISVVVRIVVQYSARYGLSLVIQDIDASYSIGQRELQKQETIRLLTGAGLVDRQKSLQLPFLPSKIAVISSEGAAGYGDFLKHLDGNQYGFRYDLTLFQSLMQGDGCPDSICAGIDLVCRTGDFDIILILRGGGAESDLFCYDDYALARCIAECPLPVLTAVGHERDYHIVDMVANCHFKTPTALADFIVDWTAGVEEQVMDCLASVQSAVTDRLVSEDRYIGQLFHDIRYSLSGRVNAVDADLKRLFSSLSAGMALRVKDAETAAARLLTEIVHAAGLSADRADKSVGDSLVRIMAGAAARVSTAEGEVNRCLNNILFALNATLNVLEQQVVLADASIRASDPRTILRQGYVLAMDMDGTILKTVSSKRAGDSFALKFMDGMWGCRINDVKRDHSGDCIENRGNARTGRKDSRTADDRKPASCGDRVENI